MPSPVLATFSRPLRSAFESAGYRVSRWAAARQVLRNRLVKHRVTGALGEALERWKVAEAEPALANHYHLTLSLDGDRLWLTDDSVGTPLERALLHLPALRGFWRQELRQAHFDALRRMVPKAWVQEDITIPPGAVIHGVNLPSWQCLAVGKGRKPEVSLTGGFFTELPEVNATLKAAYQRNEDRRILLQSLESVVLTGDAL